MSRTIYYAINKVCGIKESRRLMQLAPQMQVMRTPACSEFF